MIGLLKLVPPWVWLGGIVAALSVVGAYTAIIYNRGYSKAQVKFNEQLIEWKAEQLETNAQIDKRTIARDARLLIELERNEQKWKSGKTPKPTP